jgi:hypothetical protein
MESPAVPNARYLADALADHLADREDVMRQVDMNIADRRADLFGFPDQRLALLRDAVEQRANPDLIVIVGAFKRRHFIVDEGLQFGRTRDCALDTVAHRRNLTADRMSDADDGVIGDGFRLDEAHGGARHRLGDVAQLVRARDHMRQHEEEHDRHGEAGQQRHPQRNRGGSLGEHALKSGPITDQKAKCRHRPTNAEKPGDEIRRPRRSALQRLQHPADGFAIIVRGLAIIIAAKLPAASAVASRAAGPRSLRIRGHDRPASGPLALRRNSACSKLPELPRGQPPSGPELFSDCWP